MPNLPHLILPRAEISLPRKKFGYGRPPAREHAAHGGALEREVGDILTEFRQRHRPAGIDPDLILRVRLNPSAGVDEDAWERTGLVLLSIDENKTLVLFSSDADLDGFRRRLQEYRQGPPPDQKGAPHQQLFAAIDHIGNVRAEDRLGKLLRADGVDTTERIDDEAEFVVDVELWDLGTRDTNRAKVQELRTFIEEHGGRVSDDYVGESLVLLRARCAGRVMRDLLDIDCVARVDLPPQPTLAMNELLDIGIEELGEIQPPGENAPSVAVLDSGLTAAHPLVGPAVGEATAVPRALGDAADGHGHGTMVAGLALYGDVQTCIATREFMPQLILHSARVLNDDCRFDDENLITTQMREAIEYFRETYGCRVFNVSLGDERLPYDGGKVSPWASILDTLARDLDVVIVVSAGNYAHEPAEGGDDEHIQDYPQYLLRAPAKIIEPATGSIVLTVGSLASTAAVPVGSAAGSVAFRPIAQAMQPSPFTRCGFGLGGAIKPELCEHGGNEAYDGVLGRVRDVRELSIVSLNRKYIEQLFATDVGTSFAAPRVSHVAARLYESFPEASANLIRALVAASASVPEQCAELLSPIADDAVLRVCGYGLPNLETARTSDESRVVLFAEAELAFDNFHVFEIPIPDEMIEQNGTRSITITMAYDPPVRHTRFDYLGVKMSYRLIRGRSADDIAEAFRQRAKEEAKVDRLTSTRYDCKLSPTPSVREGSTLQKATFTMKRRPAAEYGDTYRLVVRCERKWARDEHAPQRYAVVVTVEHSEEVDLYNRIRERVRQPIRVRAGG